MRNLKTSTPLPFILLLTAWLLPQSASAEIIHLINGDLIQAKVVTLNETHLSIQSNILGILKIPRNKVARIDFIAQPASITGPGALTKPPVSSTLPSSAQKLTIPGGLKGNHPTDLIQQVQQQMLTTAGPEANEMYQNLVQGVTSGSINIPELKTMAEDTVRQIEDLQAELGDDVGFALDGYLGILKGFIQKAEKNNKNVIK